MANLVPSKIDKNFKWLRGEGGSAGRSAVQGLINPLTT